MNVTLKSFTHDADQLAGEAAALCYNGKNPAKSLDAALDGGHESVIEHATFTFLVEGVSRCLLAQITRHRLASFSVSSQRYIRIVDAEYIVPKTVIDRGWEDNYRKQVMENLNLYTRMVDDGVPCEDARYLLPQAFTCKLMITMNARELRHFFSLRCCRRAQWEIRSLANAMLEQCKFAAPRLFADAGPGCVRGHCPEGEKRCGGKWEWHGVQKEE